MHYEEVNICFWVTITVKVIGSAVLELFCCCSFDSFCTLNESYERWKFRSIRNEEIFKKDKLC